jgi:membrane protease YdiL (CAAX protease family)
MKPLFNPQSTTRDPHSPDRLLAAWEVITVVASVMIAEWVVFALAGDNNPLALAFPVATVFAFMFLSHRVRGESARDVGWRLDNFGRAARLLALPMLAVTAVFVSIGWYESNLNFARWSGGQSILGIPLLSLFWGPLQQYALQGFINRRTQIILGRGWTSILVVALIFSLLHLPNFWLMLATFAGGLLWAYVYQRAPNIIALGISHGLMTWVLISSVPPAALHNLRVGFKFFGQ